MKIAERILDKHLSHFSLISQLGDNDLRKRHVIKAMEEYKEQAIGEELYAFIKWYLNSDISSLWKAVDEYIKQKGL